MSRDDRTLPVLGTVHGDAPDRGSRQPEPWGAHEPHPPHYWRSLEERVAGGPSPSPEFPEGADQPPTGWSRRDFVKLLGASAALAGIQACESPHARILPYVNRPPEVVPGVPMEYATTMTLDGYGVGVLAQAREGRPIKIEGNPDHPASLGAAGVFEQASVLQLYDPHRGEGIRQGERLRSWEYLRSVLGEAGEEPLPWPDDVPPPGRDGGSGLRFLMAPTASPFRIHWIGEVQRRFPGAEFTFFAPTAATADLVGASLAFGRSLAPHYDFAAADVVVSLDADFVDQGPFRLRYAHDFAAARRIRSPSDGMSRLYAATPALDPTASIADHHVPARASEIELLAAWLAELVDDPGARVEGVREPLVDWLRHAARDLGRARGRGIVMAGAAMPKEVHALAYLTNEKLGNVGRTLWFTEPQRFGSGDPQAALGRLVEDMDAGRVQTLVIMDANPVYAAPADVPFAAALERVPRTMALDLFENETAERCHWYIPQTHYLERWGDARAYDGTISTVQPLIAPLRAGRSADELLMAFAGQATRTAHAALRDFWRERFATGSDFDSFWDETLRRGVLPGTAAPRLAPVPTASTASLIPSLRQRQQLRSRAVQAVTAAAAERSPGDQAPGDQAPRRPPPDRGADTAGGDGGESAGAMGNGAGTAEVGDNERLEPPAGVMEVAIRPDPTIYDGRFADNAWLLELPDPITKLTWENAALLAPATATGMGIETGDVIRIEADGRALDLPAFVDPGHAPDAITLRLGWGRSGAEKTAFGHGVSVYRLRTSAEPVLIPAASVRRIISTKGPRSGPKRAQLANAQTHWSMEGRPIVLEHTLAEYRREPEFTEKHKGPVPTLYDGPPMTAEHQWGMTIDLALCTGCSACVVACYAENNLPVVGKQGVLNAREMSWLRVDRYLTGSPDTPGIVHQPMLCQHCEKAPCEYVCPVNATVHSDDGLNEMVYNRCVGTRFCSNNCAWKVRRFNWFDYNQPRSEFETLVLNPDVTVRERGVMEKCSYCVQRIRRAERRAQIEERPLRRNEVVTACQQACPTNAIVFGDVADVGSEVSRLREEPRIYSVLHELGTKPRTQYLARVTNPDPELRAKEQAAVRAAEQGPGWSRPGALPPQEIGGK